MVAAVFGEPMTRRKCAGLALIFCGLLVLNMGNRVNHGSFPGPGAVVPRLTRATSLPAVARPASWPVRA